VGHPKATFPHREIRCEDALSPLCGSMSSRGMTILRHSNGFRMCGVPPRPTVMTSQSRKGPAFHHRLINARCRVRLAMLVGGPFRPTRAISLSRFFSSQSFNDLVEKTGAHGIRVDSDPGGSNQPLTNEV
jgi:hypothetical protein